MLTFYYTKMKELIHLRGQTYVILTIIFIIIIAVFAVLNIESVEVTYFFWKVKSPLILIILFSVLLGVIVTTSVSMFKYIQLRRKNRELKQEIVQLESILSKHDLLEKEDKNKSS